MSAMATREKLAAVLGMLGSEHDGEALNAARAAEKTRKDMGLKWHQLLAPQPQQEWAGPRYDSATTNWREQVRRCVDHFSRLTLWEQQFVSSLSRLRRLSEKQAAILERIAAKVST